MSEVRLRSVSFEDLSSIRHEIAVADGPRFSIPEFLVIRFYGEYRDGSSGNGDALYIVASVAAARKAWFSPATILDLRQLVYRWGDEMAWVAGVAWEPALGTSAPLAIVVGDCCRDALRSLLQEDYEAHCVESLDLAYDSCRKQIVDHERRLREFPGKA